MNGYQKIDLSPLSVPTKEAVQLTKQGIYNLVEGSTKPLLVGNFTYLGIEQKPQFCYAVISGSNYAINFITHTGDIAVLTFASTDTVSVTFN